MSRIKFALAAAIVLIASATTKSAHSQCTMKSTRGTYFFTITGSSVVPPQTVVPFAAVGTLTLGAGGALSTTVTLSENGTVVPQSTATGNWSVNPDCSGSFDFTTGTGGTAFTFNFVIDSAGELRAISTTNTTVLTLDAKK